MDSGWARPRVVSVVVDTPGWFDEHARALVSSLNEAGDHAVFARTHDEVREGAIAFYLSCLRITPPKVLERNEFNLVVHASALPQGRGFSPLAWQVLEGRNVIPLVMIEAKEPVDSGDILMRSELHFSGHELNDVMRDAMGREIVRMCLALADLPEPPRGAPQVGEPSWYPRRRAADSRLDPHASLAEQFDLLRVVDNERYPAFFDYRGRRFRLKIEDAGPASE